MFAFSLDHWPQRRFNVFVGAKAKIAAFGSSYP
jgi:hypothetical protein